MMQQEIVSPISLKNAQQFLQKIVMNKEREEEFDQDIDNQWKEARSNFFNHAIKQKLIQAEIQQQHRIEIKQLFMQAEQCKKSHRMVIDLIKKEELYKYLPRIKELNQSFKFLNQSFSRRQKETPAITRIIQLKLTQLKVIKIQFRLTIDEHYRYSVSAFSLFKAVHQNKGLSSVTLQGILVQRFKQFIRVMAQSKLSRIKEQTNLEWSWMKDFKPSESLKLAIDTQGHFYLTNKEDDACAMRDLEQFGAMFQQMSLISVKIDLEEYKQLTEASKIWQEFLMHLRTIKNITLKITVEGKYGQFYNVFPLTVILQMLSATKITQLQFINIGIHIQAAINSLLAMEQILCTIFESNKITYLKLKYCDNFPVFPTITTLQTAYLWNTTFRRQFTFLSHLSQSSLSLQSITYSFMGQECRIEEQVFDQLQKLYILFCQRVSLVISTHSPSSIKCLKIYQANNGNLNLSVLFPKLVHITQLALFKINFNHQIISVIPSPHLVVLQIQTNNEFTSEGLEAVDKKWPKLKNLTLWDCPKLYESDWSACKFKGLIEIWIDTGIFPRGHQIRQYLRGRGIKVY